MATPSSPSANWNGQIRECSITATSGRYTNYGPIPFPVAECSVSFTQDIAQHKRPNVPGARIEGTGLNPMTFRIKAPFIFGLQRGSGETWKDLFPATFSQVFQVLTDDVAPSLLFVHPTLGQFTCKPQGGNTVTTSTVRNGQVLEFELIQSNEDNSDLTNVTTITEFGLAESAANIYDTLKFQLVPPPPSSITSINLTQLLRSVRASFDQSSLFINRANAVVNNAIHQINMLKDSWDRLSQTATDNFSGGYVNNLLDRIKAGVHSLANNRATVGSTSANFDTAISDSRYGGLRVYIVQTDMTLGGVSLATQCSIDKLIRLNPAISKTPTITIGTQVVYSS